MSRPLMLAVDAVAAVAVVAAATSGVDGYLALAPILMGLIYLGLRLWPEDPGPAPDDEHRNVTNNRGRDA